MSGPVATKTKHSPPVRAWALGLAVAVLSGCGSAPPIRFHSLLPAEPPAASNAGSTRETLPIALATIGLPAQLDQPQWVVRTADGGVAVLEQDRWAGPLREELREALLERLAARHDVVEARSTALPPALRVSIQLLRFDSALGREALLEGQWLITTAVPPASARRCAFVLRTPAGPGIAAMAQAQQTVVSQLADALGQALRSSAAPCPS